MILDVLHADNHVLAIAKRAGVPTVPDDSGDPSLWDHAREWLKRERGKPGNVFLGVVQRLDRPVSGVVVFGCTSKGSSRLARSFRERTTRKLYWAVVPRAPSVREGVVEQWLVKDERANRVSVVDPATPGAKECATRYRVIEERDGRVLLELVPVTGRPHQLRVACAALGVPILGDLKYGALEPLVDASIALHARSLEIDHPTLPQRLHLVARAPSLHAWRFDATRE